MGIVKYWLYVVKFCGFDVFKGKNFFLKNNIFLNELIKNFKSY